MFIGGGYRVSKNFTVFLLVLIKLQVQEAMEEIGTSGIPLSVVAKAAEIQLLYAVDRVLLGSRWFRKATGIQPKLPYLVDSFERRYALLVHLSFCFLTISSKLGFPTRLMNKLVIWSPTEFYLHSETLLCHFDTKTGKFAEAEFEVWTFIQFCIYSN